MSNKENKAQPIRDRIINIADDLFYQQGYNHTSFTDIAEKVGISRGNFYYHFKTKDDILAAVLANRKSNIHVMLQDWDENPDPVDRLFKYVDMMIDLKDKINNYGCPVGSVCSELIKLRNIHHADATEMIGLFRDWMIVQFTGLGYSRLEADQHAMHLLSRTQGISLMANAFADQDFLLREMKQLKDWIISLKNN